jgi:hypothetical protein
MVVFPSFPSMAEWLTAECSMAHSSTAGRSKGATPEQIAMVQSAMAQYAPEQFEQVRSALAQVAPTSSAPLPRR